MSRKIAATDKRAVSGVSKPISLAPLNFETAIAAAMATGKPQKAKRKVKRARKAKSRGEK